MLTEVSPVLLTASKSITDKIRHGNAMETMNPAWMSDRLKACPVPCGWSLRVLISKNRNSLELKCFTLTHTHTHTHTHTQLHVISLLLIELSQHLLVFLFTPALALPGSCPPLSVSPVRTICSSPTYESSLVSVHNGMSDILKDIHNAKTLTVDCTKGGKSTEI